jgi:low affinity Fe/Cu permease
VGLAGFLFSCSDAWTTIATFLMVFLLQNTQNRDARMLHLKLDKLIRGTRPARNRLIDVEEYTEEELQR